LLNSLLPKNVFVVVVAAAVVVEELTSVGSVGYNSTTALFSRDKKETKSQAFVLAFGGRPNGPSSVVSQNFYLFTHC